VRPAAPRPGGTRHASSRVRETPEHGIRITEQADVLAERVKIGQAGLAGDRSPVVSIVLSGRFRTHRLGAAIEP
jgi:hypothetical protein